MPLDRLQAGVNECHGRSRSTRDNDSIEGIVLIVASLASAGVAAVLAGSLFDASRVVVRPASGGPLAGVDFSGISLDAEILHVSPRQVLVHPILVVEGRLWSNTRVHSDLFLSARELSRIRERISAAS